MISAQRSAELQIGEVGETIPCLPSAGGIPTPTTIETYLDRLPPRFLQFIRFCLVGVSGTVVDMTILCLLADPRCLGLNVTLSKICAAEVALINNFVWNELWTFEYARRAAGNWVGVLGRLIIFNAICGIGILFAVLLLHLFHSFLGWNLYLSNLLAIGIVTLWNFGMNVRFNWTVWKVNGVELPGRKLLILLVVALVPILQAHGAGFSVAGRMSCVKPAGSALNVSWVCPFEVSVLGNQWKETLFQTNGQVVLHGCDGRSVYSFLVDPKQEKQLHMRLHVGNVFRGTYPADGTIQTTMPWMAYCSQDFLAHAKTTADGALIIPAPWMPAWALPLAHIYKAHYTPVDGAGGLPARLEFEPDDGAIDRLKSGAYGTVATISDSERDRALVQMAYYSRIPEPEAVYQVTRLTNCGGVALPAGCFLEMYRFGFTTNGTKKKLMWRINCELDSVHAIDSIDALPKYEGPIQHVGVADYRFFEQSNGVAFLRYTVTNSAWITNESDPSLQRLLSQGMATGRARDSGKLPKTLLAGLLMSLVLCPLLIKRLRQRLLDTIKLIYEK